MSKSSKSVADPVTAREIAELRQKAAEYDAILPQMEQLRGLAAIGFLGAHAPQVPLIHSAISEIVLLRQERAPLAFTIDLRGPAVNGFCVMFQVLATKLNDQAKGSHEARFEAFVEGVNSMLPALMTHARGATLKEIVDLIGERHKKAVGMIEALTAAVHIPERAAMISQAESERRALAAMAGEIANLASGGLAGNTAAPPPEAQPARPDLN